jgi:quercetin dioxygenase-like cupin family protein
LRDAPPMNLHDLVEEGSEMSKSAMKSVAAVLAVVVFGSLALLVAPSAAQQPSVTRKVLQREDSAVPGYEVVLAAVEIPPGGREGRHTHPGLTMVYVREGVLTLDYEGKPTATYKAGDSFYVEPGKIHEGQNHGKTPVKVLGMFVVKKGQPMTSQVQ